MTTEKIHNLTLHNCDCMEYMRELPDNAFELAIVDPPYLLERFKKGIGKNERHTVKTQNANWNNSAPTDAYWSELFRVSVAQIVWGANNFTMPKSEYFCIWDKCQTVENFATAEYAWVSKSLRKPAKIFKYSIHQHNADGGKIHPTQKPVKLYEWLLTNYAKEGDKILDTHLGSGSHAIAAHYGGFEFVGCELDEDYFNAAVKRIKQETKQIDMFGGAA